MDADAALAELTELSTQVEAVVLTDASGSVLASTLAGAEAERLARVGGDLLDTVAAVRPGAGAPTRVEVSLPEGSVFAVGEAGRRIVATTVPEPTAGLVLYDLRTCLRRLDEEGGA
jgi:hypothetical protein